MNGIITINNKISVPDNETEKDIEEIIIDKYLFLFDKNKKIPSVTEMKDEIDYDFDTKAYDIIYGLSKLEFREENIMTFLSSKGCVFKWGGTVCGDAQIVMFDEMFDFEDASLIVFDDNIIGIS